MKFTYRWGQRPLDGFTIKRGLGQGGFGEVYFAVSDGGKEVALKLIRGQSETELRGITNCINLKHSNLVHLYDLRTDGEGNRWLVMEYVQGEPLSSVLNRNPTGLPEAQAREFFLQTARAVAYLHDHAVIHRDIKPGNLFVENGIIKLGDYGLSKTVGSSQLAQSSNVGTIHYMAPEIASGNYSKQIDIYACGVMLYEMLTGEVPFQGESWAEIAIKHQTDTVKLDKVPALYRPMLEKALDKNAVRRFKDMNEMIAAVLKLHETPSRVNIPALPTTPQPVHLGDTQPYAPQALAAQGTNNPLPAKPVNGSKEVPAVNSTSQSATRISKLAYPTTWRSTLVELSNSMAWVPLPALSAPLVWAIFSGDMDWPTLGSIYLLTILTAWGVLIPAKTWEGQKNINYRRLKMTAVGLVLALVALWLEGWQMPMFTVEADRAISIGKVMIVKKGESIPIVENRVFLGYLLFYGVMFSLIRWWTNAERYREERFSLWAMVAVAFMAWMGRNMLGSMSKYTMPPEHVITSLAMAAGVIQIVSPWSERPPRKPKKMRLADA